MPAPFEHQHLGATISQDFRQVNRQELGVTRQQTSPTCLRTCHLLYYNHCFLLQDPLQRSFIRKTRESVLRLQVSLSSKDPQRKNLESVLPFLPQGKCRRLIALDIMHSQVAQEGQRVRGTNLAKVGLYLFTRTYNTILTVSGVSEEGQKFSDSLHQITH